MRIHEIISESFDLRSSIAAVASDIGSPVTQAYDALRKAAELYIYRNGSLNGFGFIGGGVERRVWWDLVWDPRTDPRKSSASRSTGLQGHLYDLAAQSGNAGKELQDLLRNMITDRGSFVDLGFTLPAILQRLGRRLGSPVLRERAADWERESAEYQQWYDEMSARTGKQSGRAEPKPENTSRAKSQVPSVMPAQYDAAERVVNDVLRRLPAGIAGDIRQAIARSQNKILALQAELNKRGIKP